MVLRIAVILTLVLLSAQLRAAEPAAKAHADDGAIWADLVAGNKRFMAGQSATREFVKTREELAKGQSPKVIVLGCSDSRLSPELIFDKNLGELFVIRTAGNIADKIALGSIEYAVEHLHSTVIVVLGHEKCGAVAATAEGGKLPSDNLKAIVKQIDPALKAHRKAGLEGALLAEKGVASNVELSAANLLKNSEILEKEVQAGKVKIVKAVYSLASGEVRKLP